MGSLFPALHFSVPMLLTDAVGKDGALSKGRHWKAAVGTRGGEGAQSRITGSNLLVPQAWGGHRIPLLLYCWALHSLGFCLVGLYRFVGLQIWGKYDGIPKMLVH